MITLDQADLAAITLAETATGRRSDLFQDDWTARQPEIEHAIRGRRLLVIGGAGSIGSAVVGLLADFRPAAMHVADQNENNLAELVRDLRSRERGLDVQDFRALPIDFGSAIMHRYLSGEPSFDLVLNFAALKHVRSEKDACSLLQMLDTNVIKPWRLLQWIQEAGASPSYFSISTDKAANPVNLMGASKRLMEHVIFSGPGVGRTVSSRFANVAFSEGSVLASFVKRMEKQQPLACPRETRRFFVSLREAAQICILATACAPARHIAIPRMDPQTDLRLLDLIASSFLRLRGFEPQYYDEESEARARVSEDLKRKRYPLLLTELDTTGEKPYEEFVGAHEEAKEFGMSALLAIPYAQANTKEITSFVESVEAIVEHPEIEPQIGKEELIRMIEKVVPELSHQERAGTLDQRM